MSDLDFLNALGLDETSLPQVPQVRPKNLGQLKSYENRLPRVPQVAPSENKVKESEIRQIAAPGEGGGQEILSADSPNFQAGYALGFLHCGRVLFDAGMLMRPAQQSGHECGSCQHLTMTVERQPGTRRKFFWRCDLGHRQLEAGHGGERVIIAPPECTAYAGWSCV